MVYGNANRQEDVLYSNNLDELLANTKFQYSGLKQMAESHAFIEFIDAVVVEKYMEYLVKYNLCNILRDILSISRYSSYYSCCYKNYTGGSRTRIINAKGKDIAELLRIQKYDLKYLQEADANLTGLEYLQYCRKNGIKPVKEQIEFVQSNF